MPVETNPFSRLFTPDAGGIWGMVGRLAGNQSSASIARENAGEATQGALSAFTKRIQEGSDPQRALMDFVASPEGQDYFVQGNDLSGLVSYAKSVTPDKAALPSFEKFSPGETGGMVDPKTGAFTPTFTAPTTDVASFNAMSSLAGLPPDVKARIAQAQMLHDAGVSTGDTEKLTQSEAAFQRLIQAGEIDQVTADKVAAGVIGTKPVLDEFGQPTGAYTVFDYSDQGPGRPGGPAQSTSGTPRAGVAPPAAGQDYPVAPPSPDPTTAAPGSFLPTVNPGSIIRGSGLVSGLAAGLGNIGGMIDPSLGGEENAQNRNALAQISAGWHALRFGGRLKADVDSIVGLIDKPNLPPIERGNALLKGHDFLDSREAEARAVLADPSKSRADKIEASANLVSVNTARQNMPSRADLKSEIDVLRTEPGELAKAAKAGPSAIIKALQGIAGTLTTGEDAAQVELDKTGAAPAAPPQDAGAIDVPTGKPQASAPAAEKKDTSVTLPKATFATGADARKAIKEGKISVGDVIVVDGKRLKVAP